MSRTSTLEAIILKTVDIGEADRFCILLTKERGRLAARARGVRKLTSRMGGSLLRFRHVKADITESESGFLQITSVQALGEGIPAGTEAFLAAEQIAELLLSLTEDEEPLPEIFERTLRCLCSSCAASVLPYSLQLLHHLGLLPHGGENKEHGWYTEIERDFLETALLPWTTPPPPPKEDRNLRTLCQSIVMDHTSQKLRAAEIAEKCVM